MIKLLSLLATITLASTSYASTQVVGTKTKVGVGVKTTVASKTSSKSNAKSGAISGSNVDSSNGVEIAGDYYKEAKQTAQAYAPTMINTADCLGSISAGTSTNFLGLTFGASKESDACNNREDAKLFLVMGLKADAELLIKSSKRYRKALRLKEYKEFKKNLKSEYPSDKGYHLAK